MEKEINFGIGFVTGRSNVCKVINSYYEQIGLNIYNIFYIPFYSVIFSTVSLKRSFY